MRRIVAFVVVLVMNMTAAGAQIGSSGFDAGITPSVIRGTAAETFQYSEMVFLTGKPMVFSGTVTIRKTQRANVETYSYNYVLTNGEKNKLTRNFVYEADVSDEGGQQIRTMANRPGARPRETIVIDGTTFTLDTSNNRLFSLGAVTDRQPACDYYAGNWNSEKTYQTKDGRRITVNMASQIYGYDQYWGAAQTQEVNIYISGVTQTPNFHDSWGGGGVIKIYQTTSKRLSYIENKPDPISFEGGYLLNTENKSVLDYRINLPLFDSDGIASDSVITYQDTLQLGALPAQERLAVADTTSIRGHWYEEDVRQLVSLGILDREYLHHYTRLEDRMTRAEFAAAIAKAVRMEMVNLPVPDKKTGYAETPFTDIDVNDEDYKYIYTLYKRGVMSGTGENIFSPHEPISRAQAVLAIMRTLGLETMAGGGGITHFGDNDLIPDWARNAVAAAVKINIVKGDGNNNFNPNAFLKVSEAAALINNLINYMRDDMVFEYRDKAMVN